MCRNLDFFSSVRPLVCEDIQADVEDGQLQFFYILAFVLQGDVSKKERPAFTCVFPSDSVTLAFLHAHSLEER